MVILVLSAKKVLFAKKAMNFSSHYVCIGAKMKNSGLFTQIPKNCVFYRKKSIAYWHNSQYVGAVLGTKIIGLR